jgi:hypothetical protein
MTTIIRRSTTVILIVRRLFVVAAVTVRVKASTWSSSCYSFIAMLFLICKFRKDGSAFVILSVAAAVGPSKIVTVDIIDIMNGEASDDAIVMIIT